MTTDAEVPHFSFPFRFNANGSAEVVEQDTFEEVEQGVKVLLLTNIGERLEVPDFGIDDMPFTDPDLEVVRVSAHEWDERASVIFEEDPDRIGGMVRRLLVRVAEEA